MSLSDITTTALQDLGVIATHRQVSFLQQDMAEFDVQLTEMIKDSRILAIGAAGSIGFSTISVLGDFKPATLHVVDQNENELAELVRTLRSRPAGLNIEDFRTFPLDFGSPAMRLLIHAQQPYDLVLNFAAIKHVRSEKDSFSMLQMFDTNLLKQARLLRWLKEVDFKGRYFSVSTDKAANPSSFMGASKRLMEHIMFSGEAAADLQAQIVSARFANVAFSNGSLLQSFQRRIEQRQPLAVPADTRRYFVSAKEAGHLCSLASICAPHGHIVVPKLDPDKCLVPLEDVARAFLDQLGLRPEICSDETEARRAVANLKEGYWPLLVTPLDTAGEKPYEEFVAEGEEALEAGFPNLLTIKYKSAQRGTISQFITVIEELMNEARDSQTPRQISEQALKKLVGLIEPSFLETHKASEKNLDSRI